MMTFSKDNIVEFPLNCSRKSGRFNKLEIIVFITQPKFLNVSKNVPMLMVGKQSLFKTHMHVWFSSRNKTFDVNVGVFLSQHSLQIANKNSQVHGSTMVTDFGHVFE